jgi:glycerophosphoryl diester phosphodiesterase
VSVHTASVREDPSARPRTGFAYLDSVLEHPGSVVAMAHRGGATHPDLPGVENTLHAFEHAVALGYRYLETDVHATSDGELLAFHDESLDRVTDATGRLSELTAEAVSQARIGGSHAVPRMADLLEAFPQARFNIDLKAPGAVAPLAELVERTGAHDRVCIGSFSGPRMREFRRLTAGRVATSATPDELVRWLTRTTRLPGVRVLQVPWRRRGLTLVTAGFVRRAHAAGLHVHVWTGDAHSAWASIDDPASLGQLLDLGVDGLIVDRTDVLKDVLTGRGLWRDHT